MCKFYRKSELKIKTLRPAQIISAQDAGGLHFWKAFVFRHFMLLLIGVIITVQTAITAAAQQLVLNSVGNPSVVGNGAGKRAVWTNAGTVGGVSVDIVGVLTSSALNHTFASGNGQMQITSVGQDPHFADFTIYQAGTYNINTNSGGVPVIADVQIQINDIDGPGNEQVYAELCSGKIEYIRIDKDATTYRGFIQGPDPELGTEVFFLAGDRNYSNQPESGLEIYYPQTSTFSFGRTANNGFLVRIANPTYDAAQTIDLQCADFAPPLLQDDIKEQILGEPVVQSILLNDSVATENNNPPANNSMQPSKYAKQAIDLIPPVAAINIVTDAEGHRVAFDVIGEGTWSYDDLTGDLTFTPFVAFFAAPTPINYRYETPIKLPAEPRAYSASAQVSVDVGSVGLLKLAQLVDVNLNGYADPGEMIAYVFTAENFGNVDLTNVQLQETQFSGAGIPPVITFQAASQLSPEGTLLVGEKAVYTATYTLVPEDMDVTISNQAQVSGETPSGTTVSDYSDSENPGDGDGTATNGPGDGNDDPTTIYIGSGPDRGDAPITYGDPQHTDTSTYWIGTRNGDGDSSAQYSVDATGDDLDGKDDEDDDTFPQLYGNLTRSVTVVVNEPSPGTGFLQAFVDFGGEGTFLSLGDQVASDVRDGGPQDLDGSVNGKITFPITVPGTATLAPTFVRLRWSSVSGVTAITTVADGEVEDYGITIKTPPDADRGDAPASYGDPQHIVEGPNAPEIYLGTIPPDVDLLPQSSATAAGDDLDGSDDEDGVTLPTLYRGGFSEIVVDVNDLGSVPQKSAYLQAFIDFDGDGTFAQAGEQVAVNLQDGDSLDKDNVTDGSITFEVAVPAGATTSPTFARFRWSTDATGQAIAFDGEVEDYHLTISSDPPPFICDASLYRYDGGANTLRRLSLAANGAAYDISFQDVRAIGGDLNGSWGFNELDGYYYALRPGFRQLYRMDAAGGLSYMGDLPFGTPNGQRAGDILPNGTMVYVANGTSWQLISLTTPNAPVNLGTLNLSQSVDVRDIAYNPVDGFFYGINQNTGRAFRVDANGGTAGNVAVTEFGPAIYSGIFGSVWFDEDGRFYGYSNTTNNLFLIDTISAEAQLIATGSVDEGGDSDGASCRGPAPVPFGAISGNVYNDDDASDVRDGAETNLGAGIRIDLFNSNGTPADLSDDILLQSVDTLADGTYSFGNLLINQTYRISLDETDPDLGVGKLIGTPNPILGVTVAASTVTEDQNFGFDPSAADLSITKIAAATGTTTAITNVSEGDTIDWIITVTNTGTGSPSGVKVIDLIPSGFAYVSDNAASTGDTYDPSTGLWFVDTILSGTSETLIITTTVLGSGEHTNRAEIIYSSLLDPDSDPGTGPLTDDFSDSIADDDETSYSVTLVTGERLLSGRLFLDTGTGGGTAHDAQVNGAEVGTQSGTLELLDGSGTLLATPEIAADGSWSYALEATYTGPLALRVVPNQGYLTISEATTSLPDLVTGDPHDGEITFTPTAAGNQIGIDIGLVATPKLTQDQTSSIGRGQIVTLPHLYTASSAGNVTFTITNESSLPVGAFTTGIYRDSDCNGTPDTPITAPITVVSGQQLCVISRVSAGSGAGEGSNYVYDLSTVTAFSTTTVTHTTTNTDKVVTADQSGQVDLVKTVENETLGSVEGTTNQGGAGDILHYRIYLQNTSNTPVTNITIFDRTPAYTRLSEPIPSSVIVSGSLTCSLATPTGNVAGYQGSIEWSCSGSLLPSETGDVSFRVEILP